MTCPMPELPAVASSGDADADARFAAYLADIAAHVDDPHDGEELRAFLTDDPEFQRAVFDVVEAHSAPVRAAPSRRTLAWIAVAVLVLAAGYVAFVVRFIP